jgi:NTE family protein
MLRRTMLAGMATGSGTPITLALQGGGSHGAFTWGVLERLLDDGRLRIEGVSGTSSGAMNAMSLAEGLVTGGPPAAKERLHQFWSRVGDTAAELFAHPLGFAPMAVKGQLPAALSGYLGLAGLFAPEVLDPLDLNPLRRIVSETFAFAPLRAALEPRIFVSATSVRTGKIRIFRNEEMSAEALLASACLPAFHRTVEVDGEPYWDGGYSGNPPVFPLIFDCEAADVLVVMLHPTRHELDLGNAEAIRERALELSFNAAFLREMRAIAMTKAKIAEQEPWVFGRLERRLRQMRFHIIEAEPSIGRLEAKSRLNAAPEFLQNLKAAGRAAADQWLARHFQDLGERSSVDLGAMFL